MINQIGTSLKAGVKRLGWPLTLTLGALLGAGIGAGIGIGTSAFAVNEATKAQAPQAAAPPKADNAGLAASYLVGRHAEVSADPSVAVDFYNRAMELDPQNHTLQQATYFLAAQNGDFDAAVPAAAKAYEVSPAKAWRR